MARSRSRSESREGRRRRRRTGWDVGVPEGTPSADPTAAAALAAAAAVSLPVGTGFTPAAATTGSTGALMQNYQNKAMCRIYVGSLDYYLTEAEIKSVFQAFGTIVAVDMPKEGDRSKGFCFIEYATPEASQMALSTMQNFVLKGRTIKVGRPTAVGAPGMPMPTRPVGAAATPSPMSVISSAQAGAAAATAILAGRMNSTPQSDMASLINQAAMTPQKAADLQAQLQGSNRIYVGNVPFGFSSDDLKKIFVCFGAILNCQLLPSQENPQQHRGYGFIEFASVDAAKLAIETMNGFEVVGKQLKVNYATAMRQGVGDMPLGNGIGGFSPGANVSSEDFIENVNGVTNSNLSPIQDNTNAEGVPEKPRGIPGCSRMLLLTNMVSPEEVDEDLSDEIREECSKYGKVEDVNVQIINSAVNIFVTFDNAESAADAGPELHGRWFGGKQIVVEYQ